MSAGRVQVQGRAGPGGVSGALLDGKGGAALLMVSLTPSATAVPHGMDVRLLRPQTVGKHGGLAFPINVPAVFAPLHVKGRRQRRRGELPSASSLPKCLPQPGPGQAKARTRSSIRVSPAGAGDQVLKLSPLPPGAQPRGAGTEWSRDLDAGTPVGEEGTQGPCPLLPCLCDGHAYSLPRPGRQARGSSGLIPAGTATGQR